MTIQNGSIQIGGHTFEELDLRAVRVVARCWLVVAG